MYKVDIFVSLLHTALENYLNALPATTILISVQYEGHGRWIIVTKDES